MSMWQKKPNFCEVLLKRDLSLSQWLFLNEEVTPLKCWKHPSSSSLLVSLLLSLSLSPLQGLPYPPSQVAALTWLAGSFWYHGCVYACITCMLHCMLQCALQCVSAVCVFFWYHVCVSRVCHVCVTCVSQSVLLFDIICVGVCTG